ncbi:MAG: ABC transporter ATP-binding protein [Nonlabens sp.]|uniref:ABC transporter ATP-binding protein n=1 Tax=Nonlabens sp. TaxID=1888209 RepID=UPI003EF29DA6
MTLFQSRIQEVQGFFNSKDVVLGYRKLMDCAMDTQDMSIYNQVIALTDWKENHPEDVDGLVEKSQSIIEQLKGKVVEENNTANAVIDAIEITKSYNNNGFKLGPVSLSIKKGNVYGLVGENGNGKTTLLRILAKELDPSQGTINYLFDNTIKDDYKLRTQLIYIPQRTATWYGSLKDNLKFVLSSYGIAPEENETRVLMMIARLGLWKYKHLKWSELSSGYKMRFELARTLLRQPELLLLDEPLANLDVLAQQVILEDLKSICSSVNNPIALILSSQQLYEVEKVSDKVIFLKNGKYTDNSEDLIDESRQLIIEIDTTATREELMNVFAAVNMEKLIFNGGVFMAYFDSNVEFYEVMTALGNHKIPVTYLRNISTSTRRFFIS